MRSGASLEGVVNELVRYAGQESEGLRKFLNATGFTPTERFNRILAANIGQVHAQKMLTRVEVESEGRQGSLPARAIGLKPDVLLKDGKLDGQAVLNRGKEILRLDAVPRRRAGSAGIRLHRFRARVFQFKNYAYNQMKLVGMNSSESCEGPAGRKRRRRY